MPVTSLKRIGDTPGKSEPAKPELVKPVPSKPAPPSHAPAPKIGLPLEPDAPNAPSQRGSISSGRTDQLKLLLWLADKLRQSIAPEIPLDVPLEHTAEQEQVIQQRYQQAKQRANIQMPPGVPEETFYNNVLDEIFGFGPLEVLFRCEPKLRNHDFDFPVRMVMKSGG